ncbi:hypothetical protein AB0M48_20015 [Lentzea sp. NPDC051208]|uniref:hypothetical protein n=1 Tax=Lentzea sp. NPDC051208 TaxID=3154642 RepID=UPI00344A8464
MRADYRVPSGSADTGTTGPAASTVDIRGVLRLERGHLAELSWPLPKNCGVS